MRGEEYKLSLMVASATSSLHQSILWLRVPLHGMNTVVVGFFALFWASIHSSCGFCLTSAFKSSLMTPASGSLHNVAYVLSHNQPCSFTSISTLQSAFRLCYQGFLQYPF